MAEGDTEIECSCGNTFIFTVNDQQFYEQKGFARPKRCKECRAQKKQKYGDK